MMHEDPGPGTERTTWTTAEDLADELWPPPEGYESKALARYDAVFKLMAGGRRLAKAARACGVSERTIETALRRHPDLYAQLKYIRDLVRAFVELRQANEVAKRLENVAALSTRELIDIALETGTNPPRRRRRRRG
jgi:hypothetical protein